MDECKPLPLGPAQVEVVDPTQPVAVVPILRAGLVLLEAGAYTRPLSSST